MKGGGVPLITSGCFGQLLILPNLISLNPLSFLATGVMILVIFFGIAQVKGGKREEKKLAEQQRKVDEGNLVLSMLYPTAEKQR